MILDASVVTKWFVHEAGSEAARRLADEETGLAAPDIVVAEVSNAIRRRIRRGELGRVQGLATVAVLSSEQILVLYASRPLAERALDLALRLDHSAYDCFYLALAETLDQTLVTDDRRFLAKIEGSDLESLARPLESLH